MFILIFCALVSTQVNALKQSYRSQISDICRGNWIEKSGFTQLADLTIKVESKETHSDCDHSIGFHLTEKTCEELYKIKESKIPKALTSYLSDDNQYLYLYVTLSNVISSKSSTFNILIDESVIPNANSKFLLVIWLKERSQSLHDSAYHYTIVYNSLSQENKTVDTKNFYESAENSDQILLQTPDSQNSYQIYVSLNKSKLSSDNKSPTFDIQDSYLIFCGIKNTRTTKTKYSMSECKPLFEENHISCECKRENTNHWPLIIVLIFYMIAIIVITFPLALKVLEFDRKDKSLIYSMVTCNSKTAKYRYAILLRLGNASHNFDLENTNIDVEFFGQNKESLGPAIRFSADLMKNKIMSEIPILMYRLTKMPVIKQVQCNHSGGMNAKIYFYGIIVKNISNANDDPLRQYKVHNYIVRDVRRLNTALKRESEEIDDIKQININDIKVESKLSIPEISFLSLVIISMIALSCFLIPIPIYRFRALQTSISIFLSVIIGIIFGTILIKLYKYLVGREMLQKVMMRSSERFTHIRVGFYVIGVGLSIVCAFLIAFYGMYELPIETYYWFCGTFCSASIFLSVWLISTNLNCTRKTSVSEEDDAFTESISNIESAI